MKNQLLALSFLTLALLGANQVQSQNKSGLIYLMAKRLMDGILTGKPLLVKHGKL